MSLIRGVRALSYKYTHDSVQVPDTEEKIVSSIILDSDGENTNCHAIFMNLWPESISLTARIVPTKITNKTIAERYENGISLGKNQIYTSPIIYHSSSLKNHNSFCSKLSIQFENSGEFILNNKKTNFYQNKFNEYEIIFKDDNKRLFEKEFLVSNTNVEERFVKKIGQPTLIAGTSEKAAYQIYPYGGFYEYGVHPQEIESCVFQINSGDSKSAIKISKLSSFSKIGIDPTTNNKLNDGMNFIGIQSFSASQKKNLYDDLLSGDCKISITNRETKEKCQYKSNGVIHISNTDLITINFIKKEE